MNGITIHEFGALVAGNGLNPQIDGVKYISAEVFQWLEKQCLHLSEQNQKSYLRLTQRKGQKAIQLLNYVGVIRAPNSFQIEILPKIGLNLTDSNESADVKAQALLLKMLQCLEGFRHIRTAPAKLTVKKMPLLEIFIGEFLAAVTELVKGGIRNRYAMQQQNTGVLKGKLLIAEHLRHNLCRRDRFYTEFDEFLTNRPENRLIHSALRQVLSLSSSSTNQKTARELCVIFADIPIADNMQADFKQTHLSRDMGHYKDAIDWTRLILHHQSPLAGQGNHFGTSLLFPMEALFEAYVAKHLPKSMPAQLRLKTQPNSHHLVTHLERNWFRLKPDLLIKDKQKNRMVLDTKWKLLECTKANGTEKYGLAQADFYQLYVYGQHYLNGQGDIVLIYPKTDKFMTPLPVFHFPTSKHLRLWVLPFCLDKATLIQPVDERFLCSDST